MKQRLGGLLSLALGIVLIVNGGLSMSDATGGDQQPTCQVFEVGVAPTCPTGTITVTQTTQAEQAGFAGGRGFALAPTPPASWQVTITSSNCTTPSGAPVGQVLTVPNGGSATTDPLFVYTSTSHATSCSYAYSQTPVTGFTATFTPASPHAIPFDNSQSGSNLPVALVDVYAADRTTSPASSSSAPRTSSSASASASASGAVTASASASGNLANTGTRSSAGPTLFVGIALCLLGLLLLFAGRLPRPARRR